MTDIQNEAKDKVQAINNKVDAVAEFNYAATLAEMPCNPAIENLLGQQDFQEGLIEYIEHATTPFNIALQGEWGSGKTSLMNAISYKLCGYSITDDKKLDVKSKSNAPFYGIWVNTWQFSLSTVSSQAVVGILQSIVMQINQLIPKTKSSIHVVNFKNILGGLAVCTSKVLFKMADKATEGVLSEYVDINDVGNVAKEVVNVAIGNQDNKDNDVGVQAFSIVERLKVEIRELIGEVLTTNNQVDSNTTWDVDQYGSCDGVDCEYKDSLKKGFIFFIDDLDRIEPTLAVDILETLKNIFDLKYCIFVFAVDYDTVVKSLKLKLAKYIDNDHDREYERFFDKIFQVSVNVPLELYDVKPLLKASLESVSYFYDNELKERDFEQLERVVNLSIGKNPRYIKKCVNALSLIDAMSRPLWRMSGHNDVTKPGQLEFTGKKINFILLCIKTSYPIIYDFMIIHPDFRRWNLSYSDACPMNEDLLVQFNGLSDQLLRFGINLKNPMSYDYEWTKVLFCICQSNHALQGSFIKILGILKELDELFLMVAYATARIKNEKTKDGKEVLIDDEYKSIVSRVVAFFNRAAANVNVSLG